MRGNRNTKKTLKFNTHSKRSGTLKSRIKTIREISDNEVVIKVDTSGGIKSGHSFSEAGVYDPNGVHPNPLTGKPYKNLYANEMMELGDEKLPSTYVNLAKAWSNLIVYKNKDSILDCIEQNQITLATAGTGIGKTVIIPKLALHALDYQQTVCCCIPRRIPALDAAIYSAKCMDIAIGEEVGYFYKGKTMVDKNGVKTRLVYTTTGSLISRITGNDPLLKDYSCIVIDEAHERSIQTDILLLLLKKALMARPELKMVIMSATIDLDSFRNYYKVPGIKFGEVHAGDMTSYNIKEHWLHKRPDDWKTASIYLVINILETTTDGDILIFVRAGGDAIVICGLLNQLLKRVMEGFVSGSEKRINPFCVKLEGTSDEEERVNALSQYKYLEMANERGDTYTRKIVISTNVAESSITVKGIVYVIDSGYEFHESYEPRGMVRSLMEHSIAQSASKQRRGRSGRTRDGECYYLYSKEDFGRFSKYPIPDIQKSDLSKYLLDLMRLDYVKSVGDLRKLLSEFISPPSEIFIRNALRILESVGAINTMRDNGRITYLGYTISKFRTISASMARSIIAASTYGCLSEVAGIAACVYEADGRLSELFMPFNFDKKKDRAWNKREEARHKAIISSFRHELGDYLSILKLFTRFKKILGVGGSVGGVGGGVGNAANAENTVSDGVFGKNDKQDKQDEGFDYDTGGDDMEKEAVSNGARERKARAWCRENYIRFNKLMHAYKTARDIEMIMKNELSRINKRRSDWAFERNIVDVAELGWNLEKRILLALAIGNKAFMAKLSKGGGDVYESTFAESKKACKISLESMLRGKPNMVMFYEIFAVAENMKYYKLNIVNSIDREILAHIEGGGKLVA
jgi:HrpA-like RNA helicase